MADTTTTTTTTPVDRRPELRMQLAVAIANAHGSIDAAEELVYQLDQAAIGDHGDLVFEDFDDLRDELAALSRGLRTANRIVECDATRVTRLAAQNGGA